MPLASGRVITVTATASIDVADLKARIDLLELIGRDTTLRKVASTEGGEYAGPHAACGGGTDRLRVQPQRQRWWCRVCSPDERWQDAISYVQQRDGVTFREAAERLGGAVANVNSKAAGGGAGLCQESEALPKSDKVEPDPEPSAEWRERATSHIERCQMALWGPTGAEALAYLRNNRHLRDDTIRSWRLGWNDQAVWEPRPRWGLEADGDRKYVWIPRGITIPWFTRGQLWQFKVRRPDEDLKTEEDKRRRYISVAGGHPFLYGADTLEDHDIIILPEGEFDTLLLWQEARHLVGTATLGSAQKGIPRRALPYLLAADQLLIAYDVDDAGEKGAASITSMSSRITRVKTPIGKDITEFVAAGGRLRDWVQFQVSRVVEQGMDDRPYLVSEVPGAAQKPVQSCSEPSPTQSPAAALLALWESLDRPWVSNGKGGEIGNLPGWLEEHPNPESWGPIEWSLSIWQKQKAKGMGTKRTWAQSIALTDMPDGEVAL